MGTPRKFADVVKAWADGGDIQFKRVTYSDGKWHDWTYAEGGPFFAHPDYEFRIKPEPVVKQCRAQLSDSGSLGLYTISRESMNLKLTFEDGKLVNAEVLK